MKKENALQNLSDKLIELRGQQVMLDADVAAVYGVETKRINEAVRNNPEKFPKGYIIELDNKELRNLRSKLSTSSLQISDNESLAEMKSKLLISSETKHGGSRWVPRFFTERGLYMLATILKGERATMATLSIIETYAQVKALRNSLRVMHEEKDPGKQKTMMEKFGSVLSDIVMPELQTEETESSLEVNFLIGKLKHTVKRRRTPEKDIIE